MKIRALAPVLMILMLAGPALAADVDGTWTGSLDTPNGAVAVSFTFKADGNTLTGSTRGMDGTDVPIKNGKIDGDKIAFAIDLNFGGNAFTLNYTGVVSSDQIKMTADFMGMPFEFVLKRAK